jgi:hypothetical protein
MKNIYVLPTDKLSRIYESGLFSSLSISKEYLQWKLAKNIYITFDEEIKEGDWTLMFDDFGNLFLCNEPQQYLGIEKGHHLNKGLRKIILTTDQDLIKDGVQAIDDEFLEWFVKNPSCEQIEVQKWFDGVDFLEYKIIIPKEEPKQETLEKAAENYAISKDSSSIFIKVHKKDFIEGAKWQQEQIGKSKFLQRLRGTLSDAEARRLIFETFKNK